MSVLDQADNSRRLVNADDDSDVSSLATPVQLCSAEFLVEFEVTAFHSRFTDWWSVATVGKVLHPCIKGTGISPAQKPSYQRPTRCWSMSLIP